MNPSCKIKAYPSDTLLSGAVLTDYNTLTNGAWKVRSGSSNAPTTYAATVFHKDWDINFATQMAFNNDTTISNENELNIAVLMFKY